MQVNILRPTNPVKPCEADRNRKEERIIIADTGNLWSKWSYITMSPYQSESVWRKGNLSPLMIWINITMRLQGCLEVHCEYSFGYAHTDPGS